MFIVCCVGSGLCDELISDQRSPTAFMCVIVCDIETSTMTRPGPSWAGGPQKKNLLHNSLQASNSSSFCTGLRFLKDLLDRVYIHCVPGVLISP